MLFVHYCVFLFAYCAVVMAGYFDAIKVCCEAIVTCVEPEVSDCLSSRLFLLCSHVDLMLCHCVSLDEAVAS